MAEIERTFIFYPDWLDCVERLTEDKDKLDLSLDEEQKWKKKCICIIEFKDFKKIDEIIIPKYSPVTDWIMVNDLNLEKL